MQDAVENLVTLFEHGKLNRQQLIQGFSRLSHRSARWLTRMPTHQPLPRSAGDL